MRFREYRYLVLSDLYRIEGRCDTALLLRRILFGESFRYQFWLRTCRYTREHPWLRFTLHPVARFFLHRLRYRLGISIPYETEIGPGFYIGHFGGIVVSGRARIGRDCNISHGVTIGMANRGRNKGYPVIGNGVYIGPGAKIVGAVRIGDNVAVGANCVVTRDVPDNAVVVGVPGRVISDRGAAGYVEHTDYDRLLCPPAT